MLSNQKSRNWDHIQSEISHQNFKQILGQIQTEFWSNSDYRNPLQNSLLGKMHTNLKLTFRPTDLRPMQANLDQNPHH